MSAKWTPEMTARARELLAKATPRPGNNIALRLRVITGQLDADVKTVGPQHERFEDTLP